MKINFCFWLQWVLLTITGFVVSLFWVEIGEKGDVGALQGAIGGAAIGFFQWILLRQRVSQAFWWIFASIITWGLLGASSFDAIGWLAPKTLQIFPRIVYGIWDGVRVGALIGIAQWFVIKKHIPKAWRWILINMASWGIGLGFGWAIGLKLRLATGLFLGELIGLVCLWFIVGGITGIGLLSSRCNVLSMQTFPPPTR